MRRIKDGSHNAPPRPVFDPATIQQAAPTTAATPPMAAAGAPGTGMNSLITQGTEIQNDGVLVHSPFLLQLRPPGTLSTAIEGPEKSGEAKASHYAEVIVQAGRG